MITVRNKQISWHKGITISEVLSQIEFGHRYAVVKLNGNLVSKPNFDSVEIEDNSNIVLLPMIAGG